MFLHSMSFQSVGDNKEIEHFYLLQRMQIIPVNRVFVNSTKYCVTKILVLHTTRVAELGSLSSGAKMAMKIFVKRVFTIFASNASFLRVIANLQN